MAENTYHYKKQWDDLLNAIGGGDTTAVATAIDTVKTAIDDLTLAIQNQTLTLDFSNLNSDAVSNLSNVTGDNVSNALDNLKSDLTNIDDTKLPKSYYSPIFATSGTYGRHITNCLLIDTASGDATENKSGYSTYSDTYAPDNMDFGIREVYWYNSSEIWVKYTGVTNSPNYLATWFNRYDGSTWSGWQLVKSAPNLGSADLTSRLNTTYFITDAYTHYQNRIWIDEQAVHITCWCRAIQNVPANTQVFSIPTAFQSYVGNNIRAVYLDVNSTMFEGGISGNGGLYLDGQIGAGANVRCQFDLCYV